MQIETDNLIVKSCLEVQATIIRATSGFIHPNLVIRHHGDSLSVLCEAGAETAPLLVVPFALFIPISITDWHDDHGELRYGVDTSQLSAEQGALLDAMVAIYNQTKKLELAAAQLPTLLFNKDPEIRNWLTSARTALVLPEKSLAQLFIQTRISKFERRKGSGQFNYYLMPLIDCLNHHPNGSKFELTPEDNWQISLQNPVSGSNECFLRYNKSDSLSITLWHGYVDSHTNHLAALDCRLEHPEFGALNVVCSNVSHSDIKAPSIVLDEPELTLCDFILRLSETKNQQIFLALALRRHKPELGQGFAERVAKDLLQQLVGNNLRQYHNLADLCLQQGGSPALRTLFGTLAAHQLRILSEIAESLNN